MNSASIAKARLLTESIEQKKLAELKEIAEEIALSTAEVKNYGSLTLKASWIQAINAKVAEIFEGGEIYHHQDSLAPEEKLEDSSSPNSLAEESMIVPDSESFVESPAPSPIPSPIPVELPEEPEEESTFLFETKDYAVEKDDFWKGYRLWFKGGMRTVYSHEAYPLLISDFEAAKKTCEELQDKFNSEYPLPLVPEPTQERNDTCPECNGTGRVMTQPNRDNGDFHEEIDSCPLCGGDGIHWNSPESSSEHLESSSEHLDFKVNVSVHFVEGFNNWKTLETQANSLGGESGWCSGFGPDYQEENWIFNSFEQAEKFIANIKPLEFVKKATADRTASNSQDGNIPFNGEEDWASCPKCDGYGYVGVNNDEICHHCFGEGLIPPNHTTDPLFLGKSSRQIALEINEGFDGCHTVGEPCETCNGTGLVPDFNGDGDEICPDCGGTGYAENPEPIIESIPEDLQASDFEKDTIVKFFQAEGMPEEDIEELRSKPLSKLEASACLGFVEHYKKSAEIALRCYLVDWVNDLAGDADRCFSRAEQMNILFSWKFISEVKVKLAHHFQLRPDEINCFITPDGYRVSVPAWTKEAILTPKESEFITPNDPVIEMFGNGYLFALEHFKEQVAVHLLELPS